MALTLDDLFPGFRSSLPDKRAARVEAIIDRFFSKTLSSTNEGSPFVITGDIPAMWLRDSTWQVRPFLKSPNKEIGELLAQLSKTQIKLFLIDPYANAFNPEPNGNCWEKDFPDQNPWVFERKFELDSWASILFLARKIEETWEISSHKDENFMKALETMAVLARKEQRHDSDSYLFFRDNGIAHDSLSYGGHGAPVGYTGLVWSAFRPSDDACVYGYHVPSNLFFANELRQLSDIPGMNELAGEIVEGIKKFAVSERGFAYEVDGLGNSLFIDDANVPSLLSLPYLEVCAPDDELYLKTRYRVTSEANPYFFAGAAATGIGSQHTPEGHIWPIAIAMQALTSTSTTDLDRVLDLLEGNDAKTGMMHESFHKDDSTRFTREWFSWADMTYLELVLKTYKF
jgi:meiotically up-regulated gene 157 (Mug157) protein